MGRVGQVADEMPRKDLWKRKNTMAVAPEVDRRMGGEGRSRAKGRGPEAERIRRGRGVG